MDKFRYSILGLFLIFGSINSFAQCDQNYTYSCASRINDAIYLRDFNLSLKPKKWKRLSGKRWEITLNKGNIYRFNLCVANDPENQVEMRLFDSEENEFSKPIAVLENTEFGIKGFDYSCTENGTFYISIRYKDHKNPKRTCAIGILSFVKRI